MSNTIQVAKNTFTKGLIMDFAPETTPNTCLTHALNATFITNNGNEMSLQNDMGNGRVETARLPDGYIPVGTCEYGDIIYIVSYNPQTNKSLIGCFPSPERNISNEEQGNTDVTLRTTDFQELDGGIPTGVLKAHSKQYVLYDKKLHPGDKFIVYGNLQEHLDEITSTINTRYLTLHIVAIDDEGKVTYLDDDVKTYTYDGEDYVIAKCLDLAADKPDLDSYRTLLQSGYSVFSSKVPGKLAILAELETISDFTCSPKIELIDELHLNDTDVYKKYKITFKCSYESDNLVLVQGIKLLCTCGTATYENDSINIMEDIESFEDLLNSEISIDVRVPYSRGDKLFDLTKAILNYKIIPCVLYGMLEEFTVSGNINFSKVGTGEMNLTRWKYFNTDESLTLQFGTELYPEPGQVIKKIALEFYDNLGLAATYIINDRESYSGTFSETFPLNGIVQNYKLSGKDSYDNAICHIGKESADGTLDLYNCNIGYLSNISLKILNGWDDDEAFIYVLIYNDETYNIEVQDESYIIKDQNNQPLEGFSLSHTSPYYILNTPDGVYILRLSRRIVGGLLFEASRNSLFMEAGKKYENDAGILYSNWLYKVKISIFDETGEYRGKVFYRWLWTNQMWNDQYYNVEDFKALSLDLNICLGRNIDSGGTNNMTRQLDDNTYIETFLTLICGGLKLDICPELENTYNTFQLLDTYASNKPTIYVGKYVDNISLEIVTVEEGSEDNPNVEITENDQWLSTEVATPISYVSADDEIEQSSSALTVSDWTVNIPVNLTCTLEVLYNTKTATSAVLVPTALVTEDNYENFGLIKDGNDYHIRLLVSICVDTSNVDVVVSAYNTSDHCYSTHTKYTKSPAAWLSTWELDENNLQSYIPDMDALKENNKFSLFAWRSDPCYLSNNRTLDDLASRNSTLFPSSLEYYRLGKYSGTSAVGNTIACALGYTSNGSFHIFNTAFDLRYVNKKDANISSDTTGIDVKDDCSLITTEGATLSYEGNYYHFNLGIFTRVVNGDNPSTCYELLVSEFPEISPWMSTTKGPFYIIVSNGQFLYKTNPYNGENVDLINGGDFFPIDTTLFRKITNVHFENTNVVLGTTTAGNILFNMLNSLYIAVPDENSGLGSVDLRQVSGIKYHNADSFTRTLLYIPHVNKISNANDYVSFRGASLRNYLDMINHIGMDNNISDVVTLTEIDDEGTNNVTVTLSESQTTIPITILFNSLEPRLDVGDTISDYYESNILYYKVRDTLTDSDIFVELDLDFTFNVLDKEVKADSLHTIFTANNLKLECIRNHYSINQEKYLIGKNSAGKVSKGGLTSLPISEIVLPAYKIV